MWELNRRSIVKGMVAAVVATMSPANLARATSAPGNHHDVKIAKFKFQPDRLVVAPGDRITWTNLDIAPHTATANDRSWDTDKLKRNQSTTVTATADMKTVYFCRFHPMMKGALKIRVRP